jgi:hypothetical protein
MCLLRRTHESRESAVNKGISDIIRNAIASIKKAVAEAKDPSGADRMNARNKKESEADLAFIQRLRRDQAMSGKSVDETLAIVKKGMTSEILKGMHKFYLTRRPSTTEAMDTTELLLRLEEHITHYMASLSDLWHHRRS